MSDFNLQPYEILDLAENNASIPVLPVAVGENIVVVADAGFRFFEPWGGATSVYIVSQNPNTGGMDEQYFTLSEDGKTATLQWLGSGWGLTVETEPAPINGWIYTQSDYEEVTNNNAVLTVQGLPVEVGGVIPWGSEVVAVANSGWQFYKTPQYNHENSIYFRGQLSNGQIEYLDFTLTEDGASATTTLVKPETYGVMDWWISVLSEQATESVTGKNNVYLFDVEKLGELNAVRFKEVSGEVVDYGQFILNVLELPFNIDAGLILDPEAVILGDYTTEINAPKVNRDVIVLDLGSVEVPKTKNNLLDFANTVTVLNLPWVEPFTLENKYVIGETVAVKYEIEVYSGVATVFVSSSKTGEIIVIRKVDLGLNIPYMGGRASGVQNFNISLGGDNGLRTPFINILRNKAVLENGFFTIPIIDESKLSEVQGFAKIEEVVLKSRATRSERTEIINILESGVIFNA